jgi:prepilin-type N-terminal cleavage/methylation domain-containing protein
MTKQKNIKSKEGFTLLELLIVITIIAILSVALVFILNPGETLQKSRDTQRMSDLSTLKTAIGIYLTSTSSPALDNVTNDLCLGGTGIKTIWYSADTTAPNGTITFPTTAPAGFTSGAFVQRASAAASSPVDGTGWLPVKLTSIVGGSPISNMPIDPVNRVVTGDSTLLVITNDALVYRYSCRKSPLSFEIDAKLESQAYGVGGADDKAAKDGGNNSNLFEVGTDLTILPAQTSDNF